ncbi:MAG: fibronectin type III domain-containing protein [Candidatus Nanopelagicales bacterium]|nr:fibronectin type III domain-containing protein [Candidatus Nanopelagicales bacterium]
MSGMRALVAATSAALLVALVGVPAEALAATPTTTVLMPPVLDNAAFYEAQSICDPAPRPGTTALKDLLLTTYGPATIYIPRACTSSTSEHFDGRALDWMRSVRVPAEKEMADAFVAWLLAPAADGTPHEMARRLGIMYIIWDSRMIRMYDPGRGWTEYKDCLDSARSGAGLDNTCHRNHVHLSLSWDGAAGITSWWTGVAQTQPYCPAMSSRATPGAGAGLVVPDLSAVPDVVPVTPTPILDTRAGVGAGLTTSCRALAGRALYPSAVVPGLVPPGVGAVVLQVTSASNAPATLATWSSGSPRPPGQVPTPIGTTTATVVVPLASDGSIALGTSLGAANLSATVIGYAPGASAFSTPTPEVPAPEAVARPSKPRSVSVKSARRSVTTRWKAPSRIGGAALTGYRVEALVSRSKGARVAGTCTAAPTARSCRITGLKKGRTYWMSVSVTNSGGTTWAARKKVRVR